MDFQRWISSEEPERVKVLLQLEIEEPETAKISTPLGPARQCDTCGRTAIRPAECN